MDKRLMTCAELCVGRNIADIGTDHGYLPCYMVRNGMCDFALACDVAQKPLESAREHIKSQGLEDKIKVLLSDGLAEVERGNLSDVIMAGMGGELICRIISDCKWARDTDRAVNFVLQPMTKWDVLRKWLFDNGFVVKNEKACVEGRFVYSVMSVEYAAKKPEYECDLRYLYCGLVKGDTDVGREYLKRQCARLRTAGEGMSAVVQKAELSKAMLELADRISAELE